MVSKVQKVIVHVCSKEQTIEQIKKDLACHADVYAKDSGHIEMDIEEMQKKMSEICPKVESVYRTLEGNGQKGLKEVVIRLDDHVKDLGKRLEESSEDRKSLHEAISGLINYRTALQTTFEDDAKDALKHQVKKTNNQWLIGIIIVLLMGILGLYIDLRSQQKKVTGLQTEIKLEEKK